MSFPPLVEPGEALTADEVRRYSRHLILPEVGVTGQRRLKNARVLVVGAGGLGSPALLYLAAAGVGTLGVIDDDVVDESNLQRQVIHGTGDIGRPKVESAREAVAEVNPLVAVEVHRARLTRDNARELVAAYDLVVDGTDNFATRYLVNDACALEGRPYVWGSIFRFDGQAAVFWAGRGPCYRCLFPEPPPPGAVPSCAEGGVLGVLCAAIGSAQVAEALKLIVGMGDPLVGRLAIHSALQARWSTIEVAADPECALCGRNPTITELVDHDAFCGVPAADPRVADRTLSVAELSDWLGERGAGVRDFDLIDVREPHEREINAIPGSRLLPKAGFDSGEALAGLGERPVVVYCKSGGRSAAVLDGLLRAGLDAWHVAGGVTAWVDEVEPAQARY
ncbi:molybdopterin-synthase adenylyltransferase MoeB [Mariniluteicoccus flavus]